MSVPCLGLANMLREDYNFNPFSGKSNESYNHASGHISNCIKCIDEHLHTYLQKRKIKPYQNISNKIKQFNDLHEDNNMLADLMKKLIHLRNAFQHGDNLIEGNHLYIQYKGDKIELENELINNFQENYNMAYNWFVAKL